MSWDWLTRMGAWIYGIKGEELNKIEGALPGLKRLLELAKEANPLLKQGIAWYGRAQPLIQEALPLVEEIIPLLNSAAPIIERARLEVEELEPVFDTVLDILNRHRIAGTNGARELKYTLQSAYPPTRSDDEIITSVRSVLSAAEVRHVQQLLKLTPADGIFGTQTLQAVKAFQRSHSLVVDGFPGKVTRAVLEAVQ